jgi:hypothetical protein
MSGADPKTNAAAGASASQEAGAGSGAASSAAGQAALKAEIQELLHQVSGELQQLQAGLAAQEQPNPQPGTGTDPALHGAPSALTDEGAARSMPVQLGADSEQTKAKRPGAGAGRPSGEVSGDAPKAQAEQAELTDDPLEETPVARQPVPLEYRSVFDRLHRPQDAPSSDTAPK